LGTENIHKTIFTTFVFGIYHYSREQTIIVIMRRTGAAQLVNLANMKINGLSFLNNLSCRLDLGIWLIPSDDAQSVSNSRVILKFHNT